jgi:hypothetical protein
MSAPYVTNRKITRKECPWLDKPIAVGTLVFRYNGHTYGCISKNGIAVTENCDELPFFELPRDAVNKVTSVIVSDR